jgi:hypothetical protein
LLGISEKVEQPWKARGKEGREELVLQALKHFDQEWTTIGREDQRLLAPEFTLEEMAGGEGEGFLRLVRNLLLPAAEPSISSSFRVHHEQLDRMYGFNSQEFHESIRLRKPPELTRKSLAS